LACVITQEGGALPEGSGNLCCPVVSYALSAPAQGGDLFGLPVDLDNRTVSMTDEVSQDPATELVTELAPYAKAESMIPVAATADDYTLSIGAVLWAPLTVKTVEFTGHYFNRTRRV
jgi:hypothetical protein